jgi:hypothetical protein
MFERSLVAIFSQADEPRNSSVVISVVNLSIVGGHGDGHLVVVPQLPQFLFDQITARWPPQPLGAPTAAPLPSAPVAAVDLFHA